MTPPVQSYGIRLALSRFDRLSNMRLTLNEWTKLDKAGRAKAIAELISDLDLNPPDDNNRRKIFARLQKFEAAYQVSSADMFDSADCEKRLIDPELNEWAMIWRYYKIFSPFFVVAISVRFKEKE